MLDHIATGQVTDLVDRLGRALETGDVASAMALFVDDCYWRDLVTFTWYIKMLEGKPVIASMLDATPASTQPSGRRVAVGEVPTDDAGLLSAWISFETGAARGYGLIRIRGGMI